MKLTSPSTSKLSLAHIGKTFFRFRVALFLLFIMAVFGYALLQIMQAANAKPDATTETTITRSMPKVDESVANRLLELQDNSVQVQTLFNEARENPFQ